VIVSLFALLLSLSRPADAGVRRFALLVGNDEGGPSTEELYFAEADAQKIDRLLTTLGDVEKEDARVLLGKSRSDVLHAFGALRNDVTAAKARGDETVVLFYYSGHADEEKLELGRTWVRYDELDALLGRTDADVRIAIVDACRSGAMTRAKGGVLAPAFAVDLSEKLSAAGQVIITSSSGDENSQESDEIGGSYFTHYLASALSGAADLDRNDVITLAEAYQYVYHETVFRTAASQAGAQHPTYEWDLAGAGDLLLTDLREAKATLTFSGALEGRYAVFDETRRQFVAEVDKSAGSDFKLTVIPGNYLVQQRYPTHLEVAEVTLKDGGDERLDSARFSPVEYERDLAKGSIERQIRQAKAPKTSVHLLVGVLGSRDEEIQASYMPAVPVGGALVRWQWRDHRFISADFQTGSSQAAITFDEYVIPSVVSTTMVGIAGGYTTRPRWYQAGVGIRFSGLYMLRKFPEIDVPSQALFTVAPGYDAFVGLRYRRMELDLGLRGNLVFYKPDDRQQIFGLTEGIVSLGYRF
jgi:YD repeat-containing protein